MARTIGKDSTMANLGKAVSAKLTKSVRLTRRFAGATLAHSAMLARLTRRSAQQFARMALVPVLLLALAACAGCAGQSASSSTGVANDPNQVADDISTAIVAYANGDDVLFVDEATQAPYFPTLSEGAVFGLDGQPIAASELVAGNIVSVAGNGIMLESYPAQYPGITEVRVTDEGDPADAAQYADIVDAVFAEPDVSTAPTGSLEYRTDLAAVSLMLGSFGSTWTFNGDTVAVDGSFVSADGTVLDDTPDARISSPTECAASFPLDLEGATMERMPLSAGSDGAYMAQATESEPVECTLQDGAASFTMEPGFAYVLTARFANGEASYAFIAVRPGE